MRVAASAHHLPQQDQPRPKTLVSQRNLQKHSQKYLVPVRRRHSQRHRGAPALRRPRQRRTPRKPPQNLPQPHRRKGKDSGAGQTITSLPRLLLTRQPPAVQRRRAGAHRDFPPIDYQKFPLPADQRLQPIHNRTPADRETTQQHQPPDPQKRSL